MGQSFLEMSINNNNRGIKLLASSCVLYGSLRTKTFFKRTAESLIELGGCSA